MEIDDIIRIINSIGFPIAMAMWLLWERHKMMTEFVYSIEHASELLNQVITNEQRTVDILRTILNILYEVKGRIKDND